MQLEIPLETARTTIRIDAYIYADNVNNMQGKLNERYGRWAQKAI